MSKETKVKNTEQERDLIRDAMLFAVKDMTGKVMREATVQGMIDDFKELTLTKVSQQRELLLDYEEWLNEYPNLKDRKKQVDKYLNR